MATPRTSNPSHPVDGAAVASAAAKTSSSRLAPQTLPAWRRAMVPAIPAALTLAIVTWGITGSSYWRDEAATLAAAQRPFGQLVRMLGTIDSVHGTYYMIMWMLVRITGTGELATRFPSAVAMAAAAAITAVIGRRLVSPLAGLAAGLVFAILPSVSLLGQNARPDALAIALAALASYLLVGFLQATGGRRGWLIGYAVCLTVLGFVDIFALLIVVPHAVPVVAAARRAGDRSLARGMQRGWLAAALIAVALVSPLLWVSYSEKGQVFWLTEPTVHRVLLQYQEQFGMLPAASAAAVPFGLVLLAVIAAGLVLSATTARPGRPHDVLTLCLPWLVLPALIMLAFSELVTPVFYVRYLMYCLPAVALLGGTAIAGIAAAWSGSRLAPFGAILATGALVTVGLVGLPAQTSLRSAAGHGEDIRRADQIVAATMRRGDALVFMNSSQEALDYAYPYGLRQLGDVGVGQTPTQDGTLKATLAPAGIIRQRLHGVSRVWIVYFRQFSQPADPAGPASGLGFRLVRSWHELDIWMFLFDSSRSGGGSPQPGRSAA